MDFAVEIFAKVNLIPNHRFVVTFDLKSTVKASEITKVKNVVLNEVFLCE